jgi:hypothetical protein
MNSGANQRLRGRVRLDIQVRIRQAGPPRSLTEVTRTLDVSRNGLLFRTREPYDLRSIVWVTFPYNADALVSEPEAPATVVRIDPKPGGDTEIAVQFHSSHADRFTSSSQAAPPPRQQSDRRVRSRVRMSLPIRVRDGGAAEESVTLDVSRAGVLFESQHPYPLGHTVWVTMPYQAGQKQDEVPARVVRIVEKRDSRGVALHFSSASGSLSYARPF